MRNIFCAVLLALLSLTCFAQKKEPTNNAAAFQVLYANETTNNAGELVKSLDLISVNEVLTVRNGGAVSLIHYSGFPIEIKKDTVINIKALQNLLQKPGDITVIRGKIEYPDGPELEKLFGPARDRRRTMSLWACHDCNHLPIVYPPLTERRRLSVNIDADLCLKWKSSSRDFKITITTLFEDSIETRSVHNSELTLTPETLAKIFENETLVWVRIEDMTNSMGEVGVLTLEKLSAKELGSPYPCNLTGATAAVMTGYYLETSGWNSLDDAEKYYVLATELSDNKIFDKILQKFQESR
jgi:hypothetical protein